MPMNREMTRSDQKRETTIFRLCIIALRGMQACVQRDCNCRCPYVKISSIRSSIVVYSLEIVTLTSEDQSL